MNQNTYDYDKAQIDVDEGTSAITSYKADQIVSAFPPFKSDHQQCIDIISKTLNDWYPDLDFAYEQSDGSLIAFEDDHGNELQFDCSTVWEGDWAAMVCAEVDSVMTADEHPSRCHSEGAQF